MAQSKSNNKEINKHLFVWVFAFLLGGLGVDRFLRGQIGVGICKLLFNWMTLGIWELVDFIIAAIKAYGGAYIAMCSKSLGADAVFAWPCAEIAVMGAAGAVPILYGRKLAAIEDPEAREAEQKKLYDEYVKAFYNPYAAAASDQVTEIINPKESRARIALTLRTLLGKRESAPVRKHGNIPL